MLVPKVVFQEGEVEPGVEEHERLGLQDLQQRNWIHFVEVYGFVQVRGREGDQPYGTVAGIECLLRRAGLDVHSYFVDLSDVTNQGFQILIRGYEVVLASLIQVRFGTPLFAIITIPIPIYRSGDGDDRLCGGVCALF